MSYQMLLVEILVLFMLFTFATLFITKALWCFGVKGKLGTFKNLWNSVAWFLCGLGFLIFFAIVAVKFKV